LTEIRKSALINPCSTKAAAEKTAHTPAAVPLSRFAPRVGGGSAFFVGHLTTFMKTHHIAKIILVCLIASLKSVQAQTDTNTVVHEYIKDYGWPPGKGTNIVTVKLRIHLDTKSGLSTITVLSHESLILTEFAKEMVEMDTIPTPGKSNLMVDDKGKPRDDKDVICLYTFRFGRPLVEIEGEALGQLIKGGKLSEDQLKDLVQKSDLLKRSGLSPDAIKASNQK